jgi:cytidylate kinase
MVFAESERGPGSESTERGELPRHGFQGNRAPPPAPSGVPASITVAVSREAGSRGNTIGSRAGLRLGWPVYNQELLQHVAHEGARQNLTDNISDAARNWIEVRLHRVLEESNLSQCPAMIELARLILALAAQGDVVLIGRGAGFILPAESTLHVRITAPVADRVAYISQWLRLTREQAAEQVRVRDQRRADFLNSHFRRQPSDVHQYDLVLNSSLLGEDLCADLIVRAARAKLAAHGRVEDSPRVVPAPADY